MTMLTCQCLALRRSPPQFSATTEADRNVISFAGVWSPEKLMVTQAEKRILKSITVLAEETWRSVLKPMLGTTALIFF